VSSHGVSVPVDRRSVVDREHYLDATQRYVLLSLWSGVGFLLIEVRCCIGACRRLLMRRRSAAHHVSLSSVSRPRPHRRRLRVIITIVWRMLRSPSTDTTTVYTYSSATWTKESPSFLIAYNYYSVYNYLIYTTRHVTVNAAAAVSRRRAPCVRDHVVQPRVRASDVRDARRGGCARPWRRWGARRCVRQVCEVFWARGMRGLNLHLRRPRASVRVYAGSVCRGSVGVTLH
jgi:hypothetical protein